MFLLRSRCTCILRALFVVRRIDDDRGRTYELGEACVKCMRGILGCWLQQADRVWNHFVNKGVFN